ncbi:MAG: hypothetical protein K8T10_03965 [Candidatus Eremiobacteraeota bacterium]|nr:hypothetical protein [Candidatus Eremiobacteraeota bacterium]
MKINPTGKNIDGRRQISRIAGGGSSIDTRDTFEKSDGMGDLLKEGIKVATLQKKSFKENLEVKKKEIANRVVSNINLPQKEGCSYNEIARLPNGETAAIRKYSDSLVKKGHSDYTVAFFSPSSKEEREVDFRAYCVKSTPDGSFVAYGGNDTLKVFTPDGKEKWEAKFESNNAAPYGDNLKFYPDGGMYVKNVYKVTRVEKGGKLSPCEPVPDRWKYQRVLDEVGNIYDCRPKGDEPHYFVIDQQGDRKKVSLPQIPDPDFLNGDKELESSPVALTDGSLLITLKDKHESMFNPQQRPVYLVSPGGKKPVNLTPDGYKELKGFVQGRDGSIYATAGRPGVSGANNMPGTERMLMAYDGDGNKKWSKPLPMIMPGHEGQPLFMNNHGNVFVMTANLRDTGDPDIPDNYHRSTMQAFDSDGNELWLKNFVDDFQMSKVESHGDGSMTIYQYNGRQAILQVSGEEIKAEDSRNSALIDMGKEKKQNDSKSEIVVDKKSKTVTIGGVKLPINRSFTFISPGKT